MAYKCDVEVRCSDPKLGLSVGVGEVLEVRRNPVRTCNCEQCRKNGQPKHVMLVQWQNGERGWYDVHRDGFTFDRPSRIEWFCRVADHNIWHV